MFFAQGNSSNQGNAVNLAPNSRIINNFFGGNEAPAAHPIWFHVQTPVTSFVGRETFLHSLHDAIQGQDQGQSQEQEDVAPRKSIRITVLSQMKTISGLGGIGKTETVRMYLHKFKDSESLKNSHVIWISAENYNSLKSSFDNLARRIKINLKDNENQEKPLKQLLDEIYEKLCNRKVLMVFDNAEYFDLPKAKVRETEASEGQQNDGIKQFLPGQLSPDLIMPFLIVTSRNQDSSDWGQHNVLKLNVFEEGESIEFIIKELDLDPNSETDKDDARELGKLLGGLPLALQQAVAYIRQERKVSDFDDNDKPLSIRGYIEKFEKERERFKLLNFDLPSVVSDYEMTVLITWNVTMEKIKTLPDIGECAIEVIKTMSLLSSDCIPVKLVIDLCVQDSTPENVTKVKEGLQILRKYSMIARHQKTEEILFTFLSIHRLVQQVIMDSNQNDDLSHKNRLGVIKNFTIALKDKEEWEESSESSFDNLVVCIEKTVGQIRCEDAFSMRDALAYRLRHRLMTKKSLVLYQRNLDYIESKNYPVTLREVETKEGVAFCFFFKDQFDKCLSFFQEAYEGRRILKGPANEKTLNALSRIGECFLFLKRCNEARRCYHAVISTISNSQLFASIGLKAPQLLEAHVGLARVLQKEEKYEESLAYFDQIVIQFHLNWESPLFQLVLEQRALCLQELGNSDEALNVRQQILDAASDSSKFEDQYTAMRTKLMNYTAFNVPLSSADAKMKYELELQSKGSDHEESLRWLYEYAKCLEKEENLDGALAKSQQGFEVASKKFEPWDKNTIKFQLNIGNLLIELEKDVEGKELFENLAATLRTFQTTHKGKMDELHFLVLVKCYQTLKDRQLELEALLAYHEWRTSKLESSLSAFDTKEEITEWINIRWLDEETLTMGLGEEETIKLYKMVHKAHLIALALDNERTVRVLSKLLLLLYEKNKRESVTTIRRQQSDKSA